MKFIHVSIRTSNIERTLRFYQGFIGLKVIDRKEIPSNNAEIAFLQDPSNEGLKLEITWYKNQKNFNQAEYEDRVFDHLAFEIDNIRETIDRMRNVGVVITDEPFQLRKGGSLIAFIEDPNGVLIELIEKKR